MWAKYSSILFWCDMLVQWLVLQKGCGFNSRPGDMYRVRLGLSWHLSVSQGV